MMDDVKARIAHIEENTQRMADRLDHLHELLVGDGSDLSLSSKVHVLWNTVIFLTVTVVGLAAERLFNLFGGRHS